MKRMGMPCPAVAPRGLQVHARGGKWQFFKIWFQRNYYWMIKSRRTLLTTSFLGSNHLISRAPLCSWYTLHVSVNIVFMTAWLSPLITGFGTTLSGSGKNKPKSLTGNITSSRLQENKRRFEGHFATAGRSLGKLTAAIKACAAMRPPRAAFENTTRGGILSPSLMRAESSIGKTEIERLWVPFPNASQISNPVATRFHFLRREREVLSTLQHRSCSCGTELT